VSRCAITGATGLVGGAIARCLEAHGWDVLRLVRHAHGRAGEMPFDLGKPLAPGALEGADALVHCAYDWGARRGPGVDAVNIQGSLSLLETACAAGIRKLVFISTISAYPGCPSAYGQGKLVVEDFVRGKGGVVIRPGLVCGDPARGMFGSLHRMARLPILPVFDGGRQPLCLIHVDDLASLVETVLRPEMVAPAGPITAAFPNPVTFRDLLERLARAQGHRLILVPVPARLALAGLRMLEALSIRLRFSSDSLISLLDSSAMVDLSAPRSLGVALRDCGREFDIPAR